MDTVIQKFKYVNEIIQYIENKLPFDSEIEILESIGYTSHTQLYRDFSSITGHSVKEYIRKRRLSNALTLIKTSEFSLSSIAYDCGYSSQQALCRVVKQTLQMTPIEYKNSNDFYFFHRFNRKVVQGVTVRNKTIPKTLCIKFYNERRKEIETRAIDYFLKLVPNYKGRIFGRNGKQNGSNFCYELYLTDVEEIRNLLQTSNFELSHEKVSFTAMFAMSTVQNKEDVIHIAWDYLYYDWLPNSMFEYTNEHYFEEYLLKDRKPVKLCLYLPIKKHSKYTKITIEQNLRMRFLVSKARGYNAEQISSQIVLDYLSKYCPYMLKTIKNFYIQKGNHICTCGIKINKKMRILSDSNIFDFNLAQGCYVVLHSNKMGDYDRYSNILVSYAENNGMIADKESIFAIYDAKESYDNPKIKMYCKVKLVQNDNTILFK